MDRVIKFRAKQKSGTDTGKWWYGYFAKDHTGTSYITTLDGVDTAIVDEHTLGQFTGLVDKNGVEIYEGDVLKGGVYEIYDVAWDSYGCEFNIASYGATVCEVIGNIHTESEVNNG